MQRTQCGVCEDECLVQFIDLGETPLANSANSEKRYPLGAAVCYNCFTVQLTEVVPDAELFGNDYTFYSNTSPALVRYHRAQATELLNCYHQQGRNLTVEIACNDGGVLPYLRDERYKVLGVEPAKGPADIARERGLDVWIEPFSLATAQRIVDEHGHAGLIVANNVAAHVADTRDFFAGISHLLMRDVGVAVIEVQYLGDLLLGNQFDHIYHEHRYFFSLSTLRAVAQRAGLNVVEVQMTSPQGGSLRVVLSHRHPRALWEPNERWLRDMTTYTGFQGRVNRLRDKLFDLVSEERQIGRRVAGWAAPAKAVTLLNYCGFTQGNIEYVTDRAVSKQGRTIPGTDIPVVPPDVLPSPDTFVLLGWNYLGSFLRQEADFVDSGGGVIIPVPNPVML